MLEQYVWSAVDRCEFKANLLTKDLLTSHFIKLFVCWLFSISTETEISDWTVQCSAPYSLRVNLPTLHRCLALCLKVSLQNDQHFSYLQWQMEGLGLISMFICHTVDDTKALCTGCSKEMLTGVTFCLQGHAFFKVSLSPFQAFPDST